MSVSRRAWGQSVRMFSAFCNPLGPLLLLSTVLVLPAFSQAARLWEVALSSSCKEEVAELLGRSSVLGQVLSNLPFWSTCLNIVQSSLVPVWWYECVRQSRVLCKAALCWLGFIGFLSLLHDLSPGQKENKAERAHLPQRVSPNSHPEYFRKCSFKPTQMVSPPQVFPPSYIAG